MQRNIMLPRRKFQPKVQAFHLHDDRRHIHIDLNALVRQDAAPVNVNLISDRDIVA